LCLPDREQIISENPGKFFAGFFCKKGIYLILFVVCLTVLLVVQTVVFEWWDYLWMMNWK